MDKLQKKLFLKSHLVFQNAAFGLMHDCSCAHNDPTQRDTDKLQTKDRKEYPDVSVIQVLLYTNTQVIIHT